MNRKQPKEESIYDLIPPPPEKKVKPKRFDSTSIRQRADSDKTTTATKKMAATMGPAKVNLNETGNFLKKHEKEPKVPPPTKKFSRTEVKEKKPPVPKHTTKPKLNVSSDKNFIVANAVDVILAEPKAKPEDPLFVQKKDYGKPPAYLNRVKKEIDEEYEYLETLQRERDQPEDDGLRLLSTEEKETLLKGLKQQWEKTNKQYLTLPFSSDTPMAIQRKEKLETELQQLEKDMARLQMENVYVSVYE
eukprot:GCRY01000999.1.p1 GENE.GCRY01000999.1~~GCRY01000999.1.p1  ORF type:complete len:247 (-),score=53.53 GCRY01000999.1:144-884(-)